MRLSTLILSLAASVVMLAPGCMAPQPTQIPTAAPKHGAITFFDQANGMAALDIRLVDNRRSIQAFADADTFNGVLFEVRNSTKLKAPRRAAVGAAAGSYGTVFTNLPSDPATNYTLTAGLFRSVTTPTSTSDPAYASLNHKVGEGGSLAFSLEPGERKTITLVINAVGAIDLDSSDTVIDSAVPTFLANDATAVGLTQLSAETNPDATELKYYVVGLDEATASTGTLLPADWEESGETELGFTAPGTAGNYKLVVDMLAGTNVVSRRSRLFTVELPATVDVEFDLPADK